MKKLLIVIGLAAIFLLTGCNKENEVLKKMSENYGLEELCINSVIYYKYYNTSGQAGYFGLSPKFTPEGKIVTCSNSIKKNSLDTIENSTPKVK
jgi:major membrane immunogen (membrane-anchored lipoprotein)